jgi:hypothetical protein
MLKSIKKLKKNLRSYELMLQIGTYLYIPPSTL